MTARIRRAACALLILAVPARSYLPTHAPAAAPVAQQADARPRAERLLEALELDLVPAAAPLARAVAADPGADGREAALAARVLALSGARAEARRLCAGDGLDARLARARIALELDDDGATLRSALESRDGSLRDAGCAEAWLLLGRERARAGDWPAAERLLVRGLELDRHQSDAPAARVLLAAAAEARGDEVEARRRAVAARQSAQWHALWKARRLQVLRRPDEALPRIGLAELWLAVDEPQRALEPLEAWTRRAGRDEARVAALRGECLRRAGRREAARAQLELAAKLEPAGAETRFFRALLALDEGQPGLARAELEAVCADPAAVEGRLLRAHLLLARLNAKEGRTDEAAACYARYTSRGGGEPLDAPAAR